jgi:hypothetical protein
MRQLREVTIRALLDFVQARLLSGSRRQVITPCVHACDAAGRVLTVEFPLPESEEDYRATEALVDMHLRDHGAVLVVRQIPLAGDRPMSVELVASEIGGNAFETRRQALDGVPGWTFASPPALRQA